MATASSKLTLDSPVTDIPGVGDYRAAQLARLNIYNVRQLIYYVPIKYRDTTGLKPLFEIVQEGEGSVAVHIDTITKSYTRTRKSIVKAVVSDQTAKSNILWFNQPFIINSIKQGEYYIMTLKRPNKPGSKDFYCKDYELIESDKADIDTARSPDKHSDRTELHFTGKISPIYSQTAGLTSKWLRGRIDFIFSNNPQMLSNWLLNGPVDPILDIDEIESNINIAIKSLHFPQDLNARKRAEKRLALEEMAELAYALKQSKQEIKGNNSLKIEYKKEALEKFILQLPYSLTDDQIKAVSEILKDMDSTKTMNKLLNGDVGSGKTVVAAAAMYMALINGYSTILLAPTTILANQHYKSLTELFNLTPQDSSSPIKLITSATKKESLIQDSPQIIVSTHAILYKKELPEDVALLIVDEQHRFGVEQREKLLKSLEVTPHFLNMTATPIPRTLTNILYEEESISTITQKPKNRKDVITKMVGPTKQTAFYKWLEEKIVNSKYIEQAFIITPLIEAGEKELKDVTRLLATLKKLIPKVKIEALHGRLKDVEKQDLLKRFGQKEINVLVATTVVEVGIDYPDATVIAIENAERFGLAQLHQLRGRVGRGSIQSYCFVLPSKKEETEEDESTDSKERLKYFCDHNSGFELAEYDLSSRGPGAVQGLKQSGLPAFRIASYKDTKLLTLAKKLMLSQKYPKPHNNLLELV